MCDASHMQAQKPKNKWLMQLFSDLKSKLEAEKEKGSPSNGSHPKRIKLS